MIHGDLIDVQTLGTHQRSQPTNMMLYPMGLTSHLVRPIESARRRCLHTQTGRGWRSPLCLSGHPSPAGACRLPWHLSWHRLQSGGVWCLCGKGDEKVRIVGTVRHGHACKHHCLDGNWAMRMSVGASADSSLSCQKVVVSCTVI